MKKVIMLSVAFIVFVMASRPSVARFFLCLPSQISAEKDLSTNKRATHAPSRLPDDQDFALSTVDSAVHMVTQLAPESQGLLLAAAARAVASAKPTRAIEYCTLGFNAAEEMPLLDTFDLRIGVQEGIVAQLVLLAPDRATKLLMRIDKPQWSGYPGEDPRSRSAALLVDRLLKRNGKKDVEHATEVLNYLGSTGQYPYKAASEMIKVSYERGQQSRADAIFGRALAFFKKDDQFASSPDEFADLVLANDQMLPQSSMVVAIRMIVSKVRATEEETAKAGDPEHQKFLINTPNRSLPVGRKSTYLALRLLPLAKRLSNDLADELIQQDSDLGGAIKGLSPEQLNDLSQGMLAVLHGDSDPTSAQMLNFGRQVEDQQSLRNIEKMDGDPDGAIGLVEKIETPETRILALAIIAQSLVKSDATRAASLLDDAEASLEKLDDEQKKVAALVPVASAWADLGNNKKALALLSTGYSSAEDLYKKEQKSGSTEEQLLLGVAARLFRSLIQVEVRIDSHGAITRVPSRAPATALRAAMLIDAANIILHKQP